MKAEELLRQLFDNTTNFFNNTIQWGEFNSTRKGIMEHVQGLTFEEYEKFCELLDECGCMVKWFERR